MYCDFYHSREMQYKWSSPALKRCDHQETRGIILHNFPALFCSGYNNKVLQSKSHNLNKAVLIFAYMWTSYSVNFQTPEEGNALFEHCSCFLDPQQLCCCTQCFNSFRQCSKL